MDREILFRGKRLDNGEWVEGDLLQDKDLKTAYISGYDYYTSAEGLQREPYEYEVIPDTVCQYTGLADKNGRKIFERDILKVTFREAKIGAVEKDYMYTVIFYHSEASFELAGNDDLLGRPCLCESNQHIFEIVGNIFDNLGPLENCLGCPQCIVQDEDANFNADTLEDLKNECPLKPMSKRDIAGIGGKYDAGVKAGWNACIDVIEGSGR